MQIYHAETTGNGARFLLQDIQTVIVTLLLSSIVSPLLTTTCIVCVERLREEYPLIKSIRSSRKHIVNEQTSQCQANTTTS